MLIGKANDDRKHVIESDQRRFVDPADDLAAYNRENDGKRHETPMRADGAVHAAAIVAEALLWGFHNAQSGLCFPSYEKIAEYVS